VDSFCGVWRWRSWRAPLCGAVVRRAGQEAVVVVAVVGRRWGVFAPCAGFLRAQANASVWGGGVVDCRGSRARWCSGWGRVVLGCFVFGVAWWSWMGERSLSVDRLGWGCWGEY
jgi:hypothetical protein